MYFVYILRCGDGSLYTGLSTDPARRLSEHAEGGSKGARYTRGRQPLELAWQSAPLPDRRSASQLEYKLKQLTRKQKLKWIANHQSEAGARPND